MKPAAGPLYPCLKVKVCAEGLEYYTESEVSLICT